MPKNKSFDDRKKIMNEMFRTRAFTLKELIHRVSDKLDKSISQKTIQNDIHAIKKEAQEKGAELKCIKGRYIYEPKNFNLFEVKVDPASVAKIKLASSILKQIPGLDLHEDLKEIFDKLEMRVADVNDVEQNFIQFDTRPEYTGAKYLAEILEAINGETVISFDYQPFNHDKPMRIIVHPYLLKEYNNRWFLIGLPEHLRQKQEYEFHQYGLERVKSKITPEKTEYLRHHKFDAAAFYKNVVGVTIPKGAKVKNVMLRFSASRARYVETNPLHPSQQMVLENKTHKTFSYHLIPNPEMESVVLSFGSDIEVLEPKAFRETWLKTIKKILSENKD